MKSLKYTFFIAVAAGLMTSCVSQKKFSELENQKDQLQSELTNMEESLQSQINDLKSANDALMAEKTKLSSDLSATKADLEGKLSDIQTELNMSEKELSNVKHEISSSVANIEKAVSEGNAKLKDLEGYLYLETEPIEYRSGSANLSKSDKMEIEKVATLLKGNPNLTIVVEGHTDDKKMIEGARYQDNLELSLARSANVVRQLKKLGVSDKQIVASGRGAAMPVGEDLDKNRRTEFMVLPKFGKLYNLTK